MLCLDCVDGEELVAEAEGAHQAEDEGDGQVLPRHDPLAQLLEAVVAPETVKQVDQPTLRQSTK